MNQAGLEGDAKNAVKFVAGNTLLTACNQIHGL